MSSVSEKEMTDMFNTLVKTDLGKTKEEIIKKTLEHLFREGNLQKKSVQWNINFQSSRGPKNEGTRKQFPLKRAPVKDKAVPEPKKSRQSKEAKPVLYAVVLSSGKLLARLAHPTYLIKVSMGGVIPPPDAKVVIVSDMPEKAGEFRDLMNSKGIDSTTILYSYPPQEDRPEGIHVVTSEFLISDKLVEIFSLE